MRLALANLIRRYTKLTAVYVLPLPVAIWIKARGLASLKERSRLVMASIWQSRRPEVMRGGRCLSRALNVASCSAHSRSVSD